MFFQLLSDIHLEKWKTIPLIKKTSDVLFLAGDIGSPFDPLYQEFLYRCSHQFSKTVLVAGNHEYWHSSLTETNKFLENLARKVPRIFFLNNTFTFHENKMIFGATFWTKVSRSSVSSKDSQKILNFSIEERNRQHSKTSELIKRLRPQIVLTHFPPIEDVLARPCMKEFHANSRPDLLQLTESWACGHLHQFQPHEKVLLNPSQMRYQDASQR